MVGTRLLAAVVPAKLYSDRLSGTLANCSAKHLASTCVSFTASASRDVIRPAIGAQHCLVAAVPARHVERPHALYVEAVTPTPELLVLALRDSLERFTVLVAPAFGKPSGRLIHPADRSWEVSDRARSSDQQSQVVRSEGDRVRCAGHKCPTIFCPGNLSEGRSPL
jgi:hypothetical protein